MSIEPNTIKRRGVGLRGYDPDRASSGFTLFAPNQFPNAESGMVFLIDRRSAQTLGVTIPPDGVAQVTEWVE